MAVGAAVQFNVAGAVTVKYGAASSESTLGFSMDGVSITITPRIAPVHSDDFGGTQGEPADYQHLGGSAVIRCELSKYNETVVHAYSSFDRSGAVGVFPAIGTLLRQTSGKSGQLVLQGTSQTWTFPTAFLMEPQQINKGTIYSRYVLTFKADINSTSGLTLFTVA